MAANDPPPIDEAVRQRRARSFGGVADSYASARPSYPESAVRWLAGTPPADVLDLAAGTGKLTVPLHRAGHRVVAVDSAISMLAELCAVLPGVPAVAAVAERLPLRSASADVVAVGQAWHWFTAGAAADEAARVLRPGGRLALVWNERIELPWVRAVWSLLSPAAMELLAPRWHDVLDRHPAFRTPERADFEHVQVLTREALLALVASRSGVAVLAEPDRRALLARVRAVVDEHPDTRGRSEIELPYRAHCFRWSRL